MYQVERTIIKDSLPPEIVRSNTFAWAGPGCVYVFVTATDQTTHPISALATASGTEEILIPTETLDNGAFANDKRGRSFSGLLTVNTKAESVVIVTVLDERGNAAAEAITPTQMSNCPNQE